MLSISAHAQHLRIFACAIANDSGMFLGGSSNGSGLYQSDDTGKTWKHLGWDNIKCYSMDEVQSSNGRILYEATGLGILRSTDYGKHWKQITDWRIDEAMDIAVNWENPDTIYIATAHGPWWSRDGGRKWKRYTKPLWPDGCSPEFPKGAHFVRPFRWRGYTERVFVRGSDELKGLWPEWITNKSPDKVRCEACDFRCIHHLGILGSYDGVYTDDGVNTLHGRQIWTLKSFLVTP